jgi:DmsE family decaheme c-type cytochrome
MLRRGTTRGWRAELAATASTLLLLIAGLAGTATAADTGGQDDSLSALHSYVVSLGGGHGHSTGSAPSSDASDPQLADDPELAALRAFAGQIGAGKPAPAAGLTKLAQADNMLDAMREWFQQGGRAPTPASPTRPHGPVAGGTQPGEPPPGATSVGSQVCATCHASQTESYGRTLMGRLGRSGKGSKLECESCHGPGSAHVKAGGGRGLIISFRPDDLSRTAAQNNDLCIGCHTKGHQTMWQGSVHEERGLMCTNCHTVMKNVSRKGQLKTAFQPETCAACHQKQRSEIWRTSHMPLRTPSLGREGKMVCTDCHNPHGSYAESQLKKATVNEVCWTCHADKRGPYLWEHPPVTENCLNCHEPHGSNNDAMLKISRPRLCQQCHSGGSHVSNPRNPGVTLYAQGRECTHCHSAHHGSNNPAGARFMR